MTFKLPPRKPRTENPKTTRPPRPSKLTEPRHRATLNVLYLDPEGQITLIAGDRSASGPLASLRQLTLQLGAKGPTVLVLPAELRDVKPPPGLPAPEVPGYFDSLAKGLALLPDGAAPTLMAVPDAALLQQARAAVRVTRLSLTSLMPFATAVLRAAHVTSTTVILQVTTDTYDTTVLSGVGVTSRRQLRQGQGESSSTPSTGRTITLAGQIDVAVRNLSSKGDLPVLLLIGAPLDDTLSVPSDTRALSLVEALLGARQPAPAALPAEEPLHRAWLAATFERSLLQTRALDAKVFTALGLAAALNLGLFLFTQQVQAQNAQLTEQKQQLQTQADQVQALRAVNAQLAARNAQATTLTQAKGPLAQDLPSSLSASRSCTARCKASAVPTPSPPAIWPPSARPSPAATICSPIPRVPKPSPKASSATGSPPMSTVSTAAAPPAAPTPRAAPCSCGPPPPIPPRRCSHEPQTLLPHARRAPARWTPRL
ncbi:hypothetical protein MF271_24330 (plasmid) [Deinococcus sp. KNUC1210]|uniref:hypothetical protein n=1 Tax=Deinococcus sp. KNUC1210 TaxID=2917691 RepID=UPI001EEFA16F|nr:hypothetical protein [Deinococcus sp. KNUC1210]ULH18086.1 hypothetical protein MF271_24330 [Deinococcus sp. KNUC1210]